MIAVCKSRFFVGGRKRAKAIQRPVGEYLGSTSKPGRRIGNGLAWLPSARIVQRRVSKPGVFGSASGEKSKTMRPPPGDHDGISWIPGPEVMTRRSLPSGLRLAICSSPSRSKKSNAMRLPSARQSEK